MLKVTFANYDNVANEIKPRDIIWDYLDEFEKRDEDVMVVDAVESGYATFPSCVNAFHKSVKNSKKNMTVRSNSKTKKVYVIKNRAS